MNTKNNKKQQRIANYPLIKKYKLTGVVLAKMFGYKTANSFRNATSYEDMLQGIESILEYVENFSSDSSSKES